MAEPIPEARRPYPPGYDALLEREPVQRVQRALRDGGSLAEIVVLERTARTVHNAAEALDVPLGAIVKSLIFEIDRRIVLALIAGDRQCAIEALPNTLDLSGRALRADAEEVRQVTGFSIGGVAPIGHLKSIPTVLDASLRRFDLLYAAAGHPFCVFATDFGELARLTAARLSDAVVVDPYDDDDED